jgi:hypothetical protein
LLTVFVFGRPDRPLNTVLHCCSKYERESDVEMTLLGFVEFAVRK